MRKSRHLWGTRLWANPRCAPMPRDQHNTSVMVKRRLARGPQQPRAERPAKKGKRGKADVYEAEDADPDEVKNTLRFDVRRGFAAGRAAFQPAV